MMTSARIPKNWSVGAKLTMTISTLVGLFFLVFVAYIGYSGAHLMEKLAAQEVSEKIKLLTQTAAIVDTDLRTQVDIFGRLFKSRFKGEFTIDPAKKVSIAGKDSPTLMSGGGVINLNFTIPDEFTKLTGVYATIFARTGDDFIRISTSHKKENGDRAVGTLLDHAHPGYALAMEGKSYSGIAVLFGGNYMTRYDPIKDASGKVIGILYVGVDFTKSMKTFDDSIRAMRLGDTGGFYVLQAKEGADYGKLVVHASIEGQNILADKDQGGREYVREILKSKQGNIRYTETGKNGAAPRERIAAFSPIENWRVVIVGDAYLDEITRDAARQRNIFAGIAFVLVLIISAALYLMIRTMISRKISNALHIARKVSAGDLTTKVKEHSHDEIGQLMLAMQEMSDSLTGIVSEVRAGSDAIIETSSSISAGNADLSARTEQQARALEQTATAMEELTATVKQNADNARQASQMAASASDVATKGGQVVSDVVTTMGSINASSKKIADIISVIDGIAFQTNILALNAAVEAARAGEQGRGFAVVATEVRNLAQRSSAAAKEIKQLISDSVEKVSAGTTLVDQAGSTMVEIVDSVRRVTDIMGEITAAAREQSIGIEQISEAIGQMDQVTQQNVTLVGKAAESSTNLQEQAQNLSASVSIFKTT